MLVTAALSLFLASQEIVHISGLLRKKREAAKFFRNDEAGRAGQNSPQSADIKPWPNENFRSKASLNFKRLKSGFDDAGRNRKGASSVDDQIGVFLDERLVESLVIGQKNGRVVGA